MDMECGHAFITGKKMSLFARAVTEIFNFFFGKVTFGPPCMYYTDRTLSKCCFYSINGNYNIGTIVCVKKRNLQLNTQKYI
jgi:hypothetical protein